MCTTELIPGAFTEGDVDAETALIKSILERNGATYSTHDVRKPEEQARAAKLPGGPGSGRTPFVLVGRQTVWLPTELPELERAGKLQLVLQRERQAKKAAAEYTRGILHLRGQRALSRVFERRRPQKSVNERRERTCATRGEESDGCQML